MKKILKISKVTIAAGITMGILTGCGVTTGYNPQEPYFAVPVVNYNALDNEKYSRFEENDYHIAMTEPLSTFSVDVDTASYSNVRRFINNGELPPKDAVRIEELINYFSYQYPQPEAEQPFAITTEIASSPWNPEHKLLQIGLKGRDLDQANLPPTNLVFLIDVSGSMYDRLPLVKSALKLLVKQLRAQDRIALVVYAGAAGLVLPSTAGDDKATIVEALDDLQAGGSTAGGAGIHLAYAVAREHFLPDGNNRVILATDGDFNVGPSSESDLLHLIENKRQQGVYLTVLGFGQGNINDTTMELLADKGNGNYAYIDSLLEAKKVLVNEMGGTLFTIAKDVKIQVEFNPARVQSYRLIGYENRLLQTEDFKDDKKDAGEIGAGHTVTALYEIVPARSNVERLPSGKYVTNSLSREALASNEIATVKLRYKQPDSDSSELLVHPALDSGTSITQASGNLRFASAVAEFGMLLRQSKYRGQASYAQLVARARSAAGQDKNGYRKEFIRLAETAEVMGK
jgi:Ca-activated chloride channel family protein